ncbi:hypothetical protein TGRUB_356230, partial [Toxoplasma gondii RUB]
NRRNITACTSVKFVFDARLPADLSSLYVVPARLTRTHRPPCCWTCAAGSVCFSFGRHTHLKENSDGKARSSSACG